MNRRIVAVIFEGSSRTKVILDDGSELEGIFAVSSESTINGISTVTLSSYIYKAIIYENQITKERVYLDEIREQRFFDNRDITIWKKV
jgi:hypothetical protein